MFQRFEKGSSAIAFGTAMKTKPGPEAANSLISFPVDCAVKPKTEKITNPASKEVPSFTAIK